MKNIKSTQDKKVAGELPKKNKTDKNKSVGPDQSTNATGKAKANSGRGLANEGTVVSYEQER